MITISLCMIVKNEEAVLARCLKSVRDIADEIVIVDTGSDDNTISIAKEFTERVYPFEWIDDFSAARNFSFSKATKEYILWLDADDVIDKENRKRFLKIKETLSSDTDAVMLPYYTAFDNLGKPVFTYFRERIARREKGFRWEEPVHEHLEVSGNIKQLDAAVSHQPGERHHSHSDRNLRIYRSRLKAGDELSTRGMYYFARELRTHGILDEATAQYEKVLQRPDIWVEDAISACVDLADCYLETGLEDKALQTLFISFTRDLPRAEILCRIGDVYVRKMIYLKAIFWYSLALEVPKPNGWGFTFQDYWDFIPHMQLCMLYDRTGNREKALVHHMAAKELRPESPGVIYNDKYFSEYK